MKQLTAFISKEVMELVRTGKLLILIILFILFGIMNPAIAKLTPWLMETMSKSLSETGLTITNVEINALTSWTQFYKNLPLALVIYLLMFSSTLTAEYQKGTLVNMVTKGLDRWKIILSKFLVTIIFWSICYWICFGITYAYNAYFWDNSIASHLLFSALCFYLTGLWLISLILLMSAFFRSNSAVILTMGGIFLAVYLLGLLPDLTKYLPAQLINSPELLTGTGKIWEYSTAMLITIVLAILNIAAAVISFNKQEM